MSCMRFYQYHLNKSALISWQDGLISQMTAQIAFACAKKQRKRYDLIRFIATMIMTLNLMSDVDLYRKSVTTTSGHF